MTTRLASAAKAKPAKCRVVDTTQRGPKGEREESRRKPCGLYTPAELLAAYMVGYQGTGNVCPYRTRNDLAQEWRKGFKARMSERTGWSIKDPACNYYPNKKYIG